MTEEIAVQPGWYPDPLDLPQHRWWDGHGWTEHTTDARHPLVAHEVLSVPSTRTSLTAHAPAPAAVRDSAPAPLAFPRPAPSAPPPASEPGWAAAALTLHSVRTASAPLRIELDIDGYPRLTLDTRFGAAQWDLPLSELPAHPRSVRVSINVLATDAPPAVPLPGHSLDAVLWRIGNVAFPDRLAPWLNPFARYRLARWPNFAALHPDMDELRLTSMLANTALSIDELSTMFGRPCSAIARLITTLSLMGVLTVAPDTSPAATHAVEGVPLRREPGNLFHRIRERWGL